MTIITTFKGQAATCVYRKAAIEVGHTAPLLMFIPGNPGLVEFYTSYLNLIQERYPKLEILCPSHAGYDTQRMATGDQRAYKFYDLEYQYDHKYRILKDHINKTYTAHEKVVDVYFLSHSCGSYILQRVIRKLRDDKSLDGKYNLKLAGMICPTIIDIAQSDSGITFTRLFKYVPIVPILLFVVTILRFFLSENQVRTIISKVVVAKPKSKDAKSLEAWNNSITGCYNIYRDNYIIKHAFGLARDELKSILRDDDYNDWFFEDLPTSGTKIWTFFAKHDYWIHENSRDYILSRYHKLHNKNVHFNVDELEEGITHSFCVDQTVEFSKITCDALDSLFPKGI